jgi:hypothetical protein
MILKKTNKQKNTSVEDPAGLLTKSIKLSLKKLYCDQKPKEINLLGSLLVVNAFVECRPF